MTNHIHILGASGSGTSTLAKAMAKQFGYKHFDTDDYYWLPVEEPFTRVRPIEERINLLLTDLHSHPNGYFQDHYAGGETYLFHILIWLSLYGFLKTYVCKD